MHHARVSNERGPLAALDIESAEGAAYFSDVTWSLTFARENRRFVMRKALEVLAVHLSLDAFDESACIDIHHNFVARERWLDRDVFVHRKGAVAVPMGALALVPGSMGTASYIVRGLGCADAFGSCSHGAGRVMTRTEARTNIKPAAFARAMRDVVYQEALARDLVEEAPSAYRDIRDVLSLQEDLVTREKRLEPVMVLKG